MTYHLTEAERRYIAHDLPDAIARELFGAIAPGGGLPQKKRWWRSLVDSAGLPFGSICLPLGAACIVLLAVADVVLGGGVLLKIADFGTIFLS